MVNYDFKSWVNKRDINGYAGLIGNEFEFTIHKLSKLIGYKHHPSVGAYKEKLLIKFLRENIPSRYKVGTGFVLFPTNETLYEKELTNEMGVSHQEDIIIYDDFEHSVVFRDDDFVVIKPEMVKVIIEVKGSLNNKDFNETIDKFSQFAIEWGKLVKTYESIRFLQPNLIMKLKPPKLILFAWDRKIKRDDSREVSMNYALNRMCELYRMCNEDNLDKKNFNTKLPWFSSYYCFKDYEIMTGSRDLRYVAKKGFVEFNGSNLYDRTIYDLLMDVLDSLGTNNILFDINKTIDIEKENILQTQSIY